MNNAITIFRREMRSYFNSPVAYIVITLFLLVSGYFFSSTLFLNNFADLRSLVRYRLLHTDALHSGGHDASAGGRATRRHD